MNYAYSLLLLFSLASYFINGMDPSDFVWGIESEKIVCELQPKWSYQCSFKSRKIGVLDEKWDEFLEGEKKNIYHLKDKLKPYLDGEEKTLSKDIIKQLKGQDNLNIFYSCRDYLAKKDNADFAKLILLMPILFDSETLRQKEDNIIFAFASHPEILNKGLFGLKLPSLNSEKIDFYSERIARSCSVDPSEKNNLYLSDRDKSLFINQQIFYRIYSSKPYLKSMRPMTKEEKERCWQDMLRPKFYEDCCDPEAVERYRAQVTSLLLLCNRFKNETKMPFDKAPFLYIVPLLFEQEFTDFKNHCNNMEIALGKEIFLTDIKDVDQKPFFYNFREWYDQKRKECFEGLDFETVKKVLSYKFGK